VLSQWIGFLGTSSPETMETMDVPMTFLDFWGVLVNFPLSIDSIGSMNFPIFMDCGLFPPIFFGPTGPTWSKTERLRPAEVGVEANHPTDLSARQDQGAHGGHMGPKSPWLKLNTSMDLL